MSLGISRQTGPYMHAPDAVKEKTFEGGRTFKVLIAGAYNAGIIGPEHNGIVVLDENLFNVVLDRHMGETSGYDGPSDRQTRELDRIMAMDWPAFAAFCRGNPRYRGSMPDADAPAPLAFAAPERKVIFPLSGRDPNCPYDFPLEEKQAIIEFLCAHKFHDTDGRHSDSGLAWNVKVHGLDTSGKHEGFSPDPAMDDAWQTHIDGNESFFWDAASDALSVYTSGDATTYPGDDQGSYKFTVSGRSAGWLVLTEIDGKPLTFDSLPDFREALQEMDDAVLAKLYKLVVTVDKDTADPAKEMAYHYANARQAWEEDMKPTPNAAP